MFDATDVGVLHELWILMCHRHETWKDKEEIKKMTPDKKQRHWHEKPVTVWIQALKTPGFIKVWDQTNLSLYFTLSVYWCINSIKTDDVNKLMITQTPQVLLSAGHYLSILKRKKEHCALFKLTNIFDWIQTVKHGREPVYAPSQTYPVSELSL